MIEYLISCLSLTSLALAYWPRQDWRRYGCLFGLAAQPCWLYLVIHNGHWGLLPLTPTFSGLYLCAIWNHWEVGAWLRRSIRSA